MANPKYPEACPWDFGANQKQSDRNEWTLINGDDFVRFSRNKLDQNWFHITKNDGPEEQFLSYQARLAYQKLLDKGFELQD